VALLACTIVGLAASSVASAAQSNYTILSGTTTITLAGDWLQALSGAGFAVAGVNGASITSKGTGTAKVYTLKLPVVRSASNVVAYGTSQGQLLQYKHRGALRLTAADGKATTFNAPQLIANRPALSNRMIAVIPGSTVRQAQTFLTLGTASKMPRPSKGWVRVSFGSAKFTIPGGSGLNLDTVGGTFPSQAVTVAVGAVASTLRVK